MSEEEFEAHLMDALYEYAEETTSPSRRSRRSSAPGSSPTTTASSCGSATPSSR